MTPHLYKPSLKEAFGYMLLRPSGICFLGNLVYASLEIWITRPVSTAWPHIFLGVVEEGGRGSLGNGQERTGFSHHFGSLEDLEPPQ
jgi:hypothetical protein